MKAQLKTSTAMSSFAHLLGFPTKAAKRAEDKPEDEARAEDGEGEDDDADKKKDGKRAKKAKRARTAAEDEDAEGEEDEADAEDEDAEEEEDEEEDDEDEGRDKAGEKKGRRAERARWARVLGHANASGGRVAAACQLLATSNLSPKSIIAALGALPAQAASPGLRGRMASTEIPNVGSGGGPSPGAGGKGGEAARLAAEITAAARKARGLA